MLSSHRALRGWLPRATLVLGEPISSPWDVGSLSVGSPVAFNSHVQLKWAAYVAILKSEMCRSGRRGEQWGRASSSFLKADSSQSVEEAGSIALNSPHPPGPEWEESMQTFIFVRKFLLQGPSSRLIPERSLSHRGMFPLEEIDLKLVLL